MEVSEEIRGSEETEGARLGIGGGVTEVVQRDRGDLRGLGGLEEN